MERSRGRLSSKIHALVDAEGRSIRLTLTAGQAHDIRSTEELLANLKPSPTLLADKAYDSNALRQQVQKQDVWASIPAQEQPQRLICLRRVSVSLQKPGGALLQQVQAFRDIATRYDKHPGNFLAAIKLISARIWISSHESTA